MAATGASLQFGQQLYAGLVQTAAVGPAVQAIISPISVWLALILLLNGAGPGTKTQQELWKTVNSGTALSASSAQTFNQQASALQKRLNSQSGGSIQLVIANAIWTRNLAVRKSYADEMKTQYNAEVQAVTSVAPINAWAAKVTNGMITQAVPPNTEFNMIITNAVYFKGLWEYGFDKTATRKRDFNALTSSGASKVVQVDMMSRSFKSRELEGTQTISYSEVEGQYRAVRLPYKSSTGLAAVFVLPDKNKYKSVFDAAAEITGATVLDRTNWASLFDLKTLSVSVPRFKVSVSQLSMTKTLQSMGVTTAFSDKAADFSRISEDPLFVTSVLQSAVVQVDETGTEAAAVTSLVMTTTSFRPDSTPPLVFDRPFMFFLVDGTTQTVLFQGAVTDPSKTG
jgi:serpin B